MSISGSFSWHWEFFDEATGGELDDGAEPEAVVVDADDESDVVPYGVAAVA